MKSTEPKKKKLHIHKNKETTTDVWLTPPRIINSLGSFDLDPCCPNDLTWKTASEFYSLENNQDGLELPWNGRIWLNPPYSKWEPWLKKLKEHGNGIALIFAKTETRGFHEHIWNDANALFFFKARLKFIRKDFTPGESAPQASVLIAYGDHNAEMLKSCGLDGKFIDLR